MLTAKPALRRDPEILPSTLYSLFVSVTRSASGLVHSGFLAKMLNAFLVSSVRDTRPASIMHAPLFYHVVNYVEFRSWSWSVPEFFWLPDSCCSLDPNILRSTFFSSMFFIYFERTIIFSLNKMNVDVSERCKTAKYRLENVGTFQWSTFFCSSSTETHYSNTWKCTRGRTSSVIMKAASSPAGHRPSFATTSRCTLTAVRTNVTRAATPPKPSPSCSGEVPRVCFFFFLWGGERLAT